jgi:hypothetical protein
MNANERESLNTLLEAGVLTAYEVSNTLGFSLQAPRVGELSANLHPSNSPVMLLDASALAEISMSA